MTFSSADTWTYSPNTNQPPIHHSPPCPDLVRLIYHGPHITPIRHRYHMEICIGIKKNIGICIGISYGNTQVTPFGESCQALLARISSDFVQFRPLYSSFPSSFATGPSHKSPTRARARKSTAYIPPLKKPTCGKGFAKKKKITPCGFLSCQGVLIARVLILGSYPGFLSPGVRPQGFLSWVLILSKGSLPGIIGVSKPNQTGVLISGIRTPERTLCEQP